MHNEIPHQHGEWSGVFDSLHLPFQGMYLGNAFLTIL